MSLDEIDPRVTRTRRVVLDAATDLLGQEGYRGFTVDGVVARSGVAKTTIYRHWPTKVDLLAATIACFDNPCMPTPDTGSLRSDLLALLTALAGELVDAPWSKSLPAMLEGAEHDPELGAHQVAVFNAHSTALREVLERSRRRGELGPGTDLEVAFAILAGPLFFRRLVLRQPTTSRQVAKLIDHVLAGLLA